MQTNFLKYKGIYFTISGLLIAASLFAVFYFGLLPGIDFTGGSIMEVNFQTERPANPDIYSALSEIDLGEVYLQPTGDQGLILRMKDIPEATHQSVLQKLNENWRVEEFRFESIGPVIGKELREKTNIVTILSLLAIVLYIAWAFRKINFPAKSWQYGIASLFILFHDILIPLGIFAVLGKFYGIQITIPVVAALLTIVGYAINNVVVVYDRLRENLLRSGSQTNFNDIANSAISQTLSRQINTSLTTLFPLVAIYFLGGETLKYFALILIIGIVAGLYSSLFLAVPLLHTWLKLTKKID